MSKKVAVKEKETDLAIVTFHPINDVPDKAPIPQMDLSNPHLSFDDVLPSNYFAMEDLNIWLEEREAESRILTMTGYIFDGDQIQDAENEIAECVGCCRILDLNRELYCEEVPMVSVDKVEKKAVRF